MTKLTLSVKINAEQEEHTELTTWASVATFAKPILLPHTNV